MKSELSGSFLKVMVALCLPMEEYMAREMNKALIGKGSNEEIVLEILCSGTNKEIREMSATYKRCKFASILFLCYLHGSLFLSLLYIFIGFLYE